MTALPGSYDITARVGHVFRRTIAYTDDTGNAIDLTGYDVRLPVRRSYAGDDVLSLTVESGIAIDPEAGEITLEIPATVMDTVTSGSYVYQLTLIPPSGEQDRFALLAGRFVVQPRVKPIGEVA